MNSLRISLLIEKICHRYSISYCSKNPYRHILVKDGKRIGEIIVEIRSLIDELNGLFNRHNLCPENRIKLDRDLGFLHELEHHLGSVSQIIKKEEK